MKTGDVILIPRVKGNLHRMEESNDGCKDGTLCSGGRMLKFEIRSARVKVQTT